MFNLILVRHGESVADIEKRCEGRADFDLTERGYEQVSCLAKHLKETISIDMIFSSPLIRAFHTAEKVALLQELKVLKVDDLMEMNNGHLAGLKHETASKLYPYPPDGYKIYDEIPGGESVLDFRFRIEKFWHKFFNEYKDSNKTICIFAHGGTITTLIRTILRLPTDTNVKFVSGDTAYHHLIFTDNEVKFLKINCEEHLSYDMRKRD